MGKNRLRKYLKENNFVVFFKYIYIYRPAIKHLRVRNHMRVKLLEVLIKAILRQRRCDVIISHGRVSTNLIMLLYFKLLSLKFIFPITQKSVYN